MYRVLRRSALQRVALVVTAALGLGIGLGTTAIAADGYSRSTVTPIITLPDVARAPIGNVGPFTQDYIENFDTAAAADGPFAATYADSWQPYAEGTSDKYYSGSQISAHDGYMDVALDGKHGSAGTFGTPTGAWSHIGGKFTIRARAVAGKGNGVAVMLWPTSNTWSDGEINYPEGNFDGQPEVNHHSMVPGQEKSVQFWGTGVSWRAWHTYSIEWIPGKSVKYYLDGVLVDTVTTQVPTTAHRYMFQVGNWGAAGDFEVDWVTTYDYSG